ncbi:hypothetical protein BDQ17DRAFT_1349310 [Cyathus striatus]|nr:hypothetical protein BDQ17DRAFT_1349310 [Cyathus striatus]
MTSDAPDAFRLLTLPDASLTSSGHSERGHLSLECVTIQIPESAPESRDVYLVLRLNSSETPIDPATVIQRSDSPTSRSYMFSATQVYPAETVLTIPIKLSRDTQLLEDLETFEGILSQYAELRGSPQYSSGKTTTPSAVGVETSDEKDLRGHLVMINEDTGEVVGEIEDRFKITEDPLIHERGHENDPVIIEVPDDTLAQSDATTMEVFARIVPPDQQDWITKSATVVSHAISMTTNLLLTTITTASNYYINRSSPSPHCASSRAPAGAVMFLTSERTRKGLATVHAVSGGAVKVSTETVKVIDSMIRRAMGAKPKRVRTQFGGSNNTNSAVAGSSSLLPGSQQDIPRAISPKPDTLAPPPYSETFHPPNSSGNKPPLPPRRSPSPIAPSLPPRSETVTPIGTGNNFAHPPQPKLTKKERILISADLVLSTIDDSTRKVLDVGTEQIGKVMGHKYGPDAAHSSLLMAGTARNVGLVYVDMRGIGRRALLKRAGRTWVKARISSNQSGNQPQPGYKAEQPNKS